VGENRDREFVIAHFTAVAAAAAAADQANALPTKIRRIRHQCLI